MRKRFLLTACTLSLLAAPIACSGGGSKGGFTIPEEQLEPGGAFVAYTIGCEKGCDKIVRGDLIQEIDGEKVESGSDFDSAGITDGEPHKVKVYKQATKAAIEVEVVAEPSGKVPPIDDAPPFWTATASELNLAPSWARRRLFGHASPQINIVSIDGGFANGRDFYGEKGFFVYFDHAVPSELAFASTFMQVLQKAQNDLKSKGISIFFAQVSLPGRSVQPMNDSDLRAFHEKHQVGPDNGGPLPFVPMYRLPNNTEHNPANELGMEGAFNLLANIGSSPAILLMDERGIIRWHSEGVEEQPAGATTKMPPDVYTIIESVQFALEKL